MTTLTTFNQNYTYTSDGKTITVRDGLITGIV